MAEVKSRQPLFGKDVRSNKKRGRKPRDLTGLRFGRLKVIARMFALQKGHSYWLCSCSCGKDVSVSAANLTRSKGGTRSCGCLMKDYLVGIKNRTKQRHCKHLTDDQVAEIRWLYKSGEVSQRSLADQFGVAILTISNIVNNITRVPGRPRQPKRRKLNIVEGIEITPGS